MGGGFLLNGCDGPGQVGTELVEPRELGCDGSCDGPAWAFCTGGQVGTELWQLTELLELTEPGCGGELWPAAAALA